MLALGTLLNCGLRYGGGSAFPAVSLRGGTFAIAGWGALMAASVRAPLTGSCAGAGDDR